MATKTPTRFPVGGVTTAAQTDPLALFGLPDPTKWIVYWNDMADGWDTLPNATDQNYTVTKTGAGTVAAADGLGGLAILTNAAANGDAVFMQRKGEAFKFAADKRMLFTARFQGSDANLSAIVMGLQITDTTPLAVSDGFYFLKASAATTFSFIAAKASALSTTASVATLANATNIQLSFSYNGRPFQIDGTTYYQFQFFVNGVQTGYVNLTSANIPTEELCISFGVQNGEAVAKTMTIDYIFAALER